MREMFKIHFVDLVEDMKIPSWNDGKLAGAKAAVCGYQRRATTNKKELVNCKLCLRVMNK